MAAIVKSGAIRENPAARAEERRTAGLHLTTSGGTLGAASPMPDLFFLAHPQGMSRQSHREPLGRAASPEVAARPALLPYFIEICRLVPGTLAELAGRRRIAA